MLLTPLGLIPICIVIAVAVAIWFSNPENRDDSI